MANSAIGAEKFEWRKGEMFDKGDIPMLSSFKEAEAKTASPKPLRDAIRAAYRDHVLWAKTLPYLTPPGICGSKSYDQAYVVRDLLEWDAKHGEYITMYCHENRISPRMLWNYCYEIFGRVFRTSHGRVVGILEAGEKPGSGGEDSGADLE
jgi:hypothetical protein